MKRYRFTKPFLALLLILVASFGGTIWYFSRQASTNQQTENQPAVLAARDENYFETTPPEDLKTLNVLLLGYGGPGHQGGFLADVIQVIHFDFENSKIAFISIPRDLWVTLPSGTSKKINQAFAEDIASQKSFTQAPITKDMANIVTGLPIDYFVGVDFVGFQRLIGEELGGIDVEVTETLDDPWYPIRGEELNTCGMSAEEVAQLSAQYSGFELERKFECRYKHLLFKPGKIKMEGGDALAFSRSRHGSAGGDFSRSKRQQAVLHGIKNKLFTLEVFKNAPEFFEEISHTISTDLSLDAITYLTPALKLSQNYSIQEINLSTENVFMSSKSINGQSIVVPKAGNNSWKAVHLFIQATIDGQT